MIVYQNISQNNSDESSIWRVFRIRIREQYPPRGILDIFKQELQTTHRSVNVRKRSLTFTSYPKKLKAWGENIAFSGAEVPFESVMDGFIEEDMKYRGQAHRRNMLNKNFNAVGVAAYKKGDVVYWVQSFGKF